MTVLHDTGYALRTLTKQPGFALVALLTLALGIGANTAIFGIVNAVLLRPLPYDQPDRVVVLWSHWINWTKTWVSQPELADYQQLRSLEHVGSSTRRSTSPALENRCGCWPRRCSRRSSPRSAPVHSSDACSRRRRTSPAASTS